MTVPKMVLRIGLFMTVSKMVLRGVLRLILIIVKKMILGKVLRMAKLANWLGRFFI